MRFRIVQRSVSQTLAGCALLIACASVSIVRSAPLDHADVAAAINAVLDSACVQARCDTVVLDRVIRNTRHWVPFASDSTPAFTLSQAPELHWPIRLKDLGQCCPTAGTETRVWVWLVNDTTARSGSRTYTVSVQLYRWSLTGAADVRADATGWVVERLRFITT